MNSETAVERHGGAVASSRTTATPSEGQALRFWLKLGMISFGGPAGQIAIMHDELVERRCWISERRFLHALNFCMALPGPEAQQLASYIGYSMHGVRGAITAGGLFVLPSFVLICFMSAIYVEYGEVGAVAGIVRGLGAAVIALVAAAVLRIGGRVLHTPAAFVLAAAAFGLIVAGVPFPAIIALAAVIGFFAGTRRPHLLGKSTAHGGEEDVANDSTPETGLRRRFVKMLLLWLVPLAALLLAGGLVAELAAFFTLAALVTFLDAGVLLPTLRRLLGRRASQNVVSWGDRDKPGAVILVAHCDAGRGGIALGQRAEERRAAFGNLVRRPIGPLEPLLWAELAVLVCCILRLASLSGLLLTVVQFLPTVLLIVAVALLLDIALSPTTAGENVSARNNIAERYISDPPNAIRV